MTDQIYPSNIDKVREILSNPENIELNDGQKNVTQMRSTPAGLRPKAQALLNAATFAGNIKPVLERPYIIKGWLDRDTLSVVYGPSNVGKSFLAVDIAHHVSKGRSWGDHRVSKGQVLYVAAEGGGTFSNRVAALDDPAFWVMGLPMTLTGPNGQAQPLSEAIQHLSTTSGQSFDLIVLDTMARVMGGLDENNAPGIADLMRNLDVIRQATGAHVMLIHHTGKDVTRGARGHSSLRAAIDTEIELTRDDFGQITAEVTKQRDGPTGYRFVYNLRQVELGHDQDGDPVTTCLVEPTGAAEVARVALPGTAQKALKILDTMLADEREVSSGSGHPQQNGIHIEKWRLACTEDGGISMSADPKNRGRTHRMATEKLLNAGMIHIRGEIVWRVEA